MLFTIERLGAQGLLLSFGLEGLCAIDMLAERGYDMVQPRSTKWKCFPCSPLAALVIFSSESTLLALGTDVAAKGLARDVMVPEWPCGKKMMFCILCKASLICLKKMDAGV